MKCENGNCHADRDAIKKHTTCACVSDQMDQSTVHFEQIVDLSVRSSRNQNNVGQIKDLHYRVHVPVLVPIFSPSLFPIDRLS